MIGFNGKKQREINVRVNATPTDTLEEIVRKIDKENVIQDVYDDPMFTLGYLNSSALSVSFNTGDKYELIVGYIFNGSRRSITFYADVIQDPDDDTKLAFSYSTEESKDIGKQTLEQMGGFPKEKFEIEEIGLGFSTLDPKKHKRRRVILYEKGQTRTEQEGLVAGMAMYAKESWEAARAGVHPKNRRMARTVYHAIIYGVPTAVVLGTATCVAGNVIYYHVLPKALYLFGVHFQTQPPPLP